MKAWEACGYDIKKKKGYYDLHRRPLRRFEDLGNTGIKSIEIISCSTDKYMVEILRIIEELKENNPTLQPDDIGIMFLENIDRNYQLANNLQIRIREKFGWDVNIGYESKEKRRGTVFISNRNNVKGLEFSFLFPFSVEKQDRHYRIYDNVTDFELSDKTISLLISIFRQSEAFENSFEKTFDYVVESIEEYEYENVDDIWSIVIRLWYMEDGYVRYDYDPVHQNGDLHPLYHLDINYSTGAAYKLGLKKPLLIGEFRNILDIKTDCAYLSAGC